MDVVFWLAVLRLIAYGVLAPICMLLGIDRFNLGRGWSAGFYCSLCVFFLTFLVLIVVDFSGGVEVTWLLRLLATPPVVASAFFGIGSVAWGSS